MFFCLHPLNSQPENQLAHPRPRLAAPCTDVNCTVRKNTFGRGVFIKPQAALEGQHSYVNFVVMFIRSYFLSYLIYAGRQTHLCPPAHCLFLFKVNTLILILSWHYPPVYPKSFELLYRKLVPWFHEVLSSCTSVDTLEHLFLSGNISILDGSSPVNTVCRRQ